MDAGQTLCAFQLPSCLKSSLRLADRLIFVCCKWGSQFPANAVNALFRGVSRNIGEPFRFVCVTDDEEGLHPEVETLPFPEMNLPPEGWRKGCWPKLAVFKPGMLDAEVVMYLDLDVLVLSSLTPFVELVRRQGGFHILREWNPLLLTMLPLTLRPDRGAQSSVFAFRPADVPDIFPAFIADTARALSIAPNDQAYLTKAVPNIRYWPPGFCMSFKRSLVWHYPLNLVFRAIRKPRDVSIVVFHGSPRPWDLLGPEEKRWGTRWRFGFGPVDWVQAYYEGGCIKTKHQKKIGLVERSSPGQVLEPSMTQDQSTVLNPG